MRFELGDAAEDVGGEELAEGEVVGVPAAVYCSVLEACNWEPADGATDFGRRRAASRLCGRLRRGLALRTRWGQRAFRRRLDELVEVSRDLQGRSTMLAALESLLRQVVVRGGRRCDDDHIYVAVLV